MYHICVHNMHQTPNKSHIICISKTDGLAYHFFAPTYHLSQLYILLMVQKSCTTWDVWNPVNNGINYLSTGAGFLPSTVSPVSHWEFPDFAAGAEADGTSSSAVSTWFSMLRSWNIQCVYLCKYKYIYIYKPNIYIYICIYVNIYVSSFSYLIYVYTFHRLYLVPVSMMYVLFLAHWLPQN